MSPKKSLFWFNCITNSVSYATVIVLKPSMYLFYLAQSIKCDLRPIRQIVADERATKIAPGQSQQILEHMTNKTDKYQCDKCDKYYTYYYLDQHKKLHHSGRFKFNEEPKTLI